MVYSFSYMSQTTLLKVSEVAQVLKLNILTVYQYIRQEKLSAVKIGRNYRIEEKDLRGFIEKHKVKSK